MTRMIETTFTLNITVSEEGFRVEGLEEYLSSGDDLAKFLKDMCPREEMPPLSRDCRFASVYANEEQRARAEKFKQTKPSVKVWRDTKEHPQPKEVLDEMDAYRVEYKRLQRKFPRAEKEVLEQKVKAIMDIRKSLLDDLDL